MSDAPAPSSSSPPAAPAATEAAPAATSEEATATTSTTTSTTTPSLFGSAGSASGGSIFASAGSGQGGDAAGGSIFAPASFGAAAPFGAPAAPAGEGAAAAGEDDDDEHAGADERHAQDFAPLVNLPKVEIKSEEEDEEVMFKCRSKLYLFVKEDVYGGEKRTNFWKERGTGDVKLLKHKELGKVRLLMRQEQTLKICANHLVSPSVHLEPNVGSDRSWVFSANDFADGQIVESTFAIKFGSVENAQKFKDAVMEAGAINGATAPAPAPAAAEDGAKAEGSKEDAAELAKDVEKLDVKEKQAE